ncbi:MAG: alpha/beta fold hydrolase [Zoogloeaceae bacterium]|nr:alpha/beta fold hydrolase [Zoogloeaceae bacterium]
MPPAQAAEKSQRYPQSDPWLSTILGTPLDERAPYLQDIPTRLIDLEVFPDRQVPDAFWYNDRLRSSLAYQEGKAPLIFIIAGTGAGFNSDKMLSLRSIFYQAGFHVVSISSPTHANFVTAASESRAPGILRDDANDLYRVMQTLWAELKDEIEVSDFYLTGYSLGGTQAAFVSKLDDEQKTFNFSKVLMINPAVNLFTSVSLLDSMLEDNIPGGAAGVRRFLSRALDKFATVYSKGDFVKFDHEFLFNIYRGLPEAPTDANLKSLIGISFRISSSNMIFAADVMRDAGFVVPKGYVLGRNDPLDAYLKTLAYISFATYLDDFLLPAAQERDPALTRQALINGSSLRAISGYLDQSQKIGVMTNADDIILGTGDLDYLRQTFGNRATIFPHGGHCGNIDQRDFAAAMTRYFSQP